MAVARDGHFIRHTHALVRHTAFKYGARRFVLTSPPVMPYLVANSGPESGRRIPIPPQGLAIGRVADANQMAIADPGISRRHARITFSSSGEARLEDLSVNGSYVNDHRVHEPTTLVSGDVVRFGTHSYTYEGPVPARAPGPSSSFAAAAPQRSAASPRAGAEPRCWLQLVVDQRSSSQIDLHPPGLRIGRTAGAGRLLIAHPTVSTTHAEIAVDAEGHARLRDLDSTNGTFVNGEPVHDHSLEEGDLIQLGSCESHLLLFRETERRPLRLTDVDVSRPQVTLGRASDAGICLDHPTVSLRHAEIRNRNGAITIADLGSTNGTFVNGVAVHGAQPLRPGDRVALGALQFVFDGSHFEGASDAGRASLSAVNLRVEVRDRASQKTKRLLDDISMVIEPCQFIGLLGGSGAGKSTLMDALNGARPAQKGRVMLNHADLYKEFAALRSMIGYVPQDDILHAELTGRECLYYSARLRLPDDYGEAALQSRISEVIDVLELKDQANLPIRSLSGGQRKRVSVGIELLSNPSILFLDEPTAGQDPKNEQQMMQLFRRIANKGASVIINTHLLGSFGLLDRVAVLVQGKMAYYGPAEDMLGYFECDEPHEVYYRLKDGETPEEWARRYRQSPQFREYALPSGAARITTDPSLDTDDPISEAPAPRHSALRQMATLLSRQFTLKLKDKTSLATLLLPPSIIAILIGVMNWPVANSAGKLTFSANSPMTLFMMVLVALWFGCSSTVREIVDESKIYRRERQRDLKLSSYLGCKLVYLAGLAAVQSGLFMLVVGAMGVLANHLLTAWALMWMLTVQGGLIGYLISAVADSAEKALYAFPLVMIAELLFAGMLVPTAPLHPVYAHADYAPSGQVRALTIYDQPSWLPMGQPMSAKLRDTLSAVMISRWSLEALASLYADDVARMPDCFAEQADAARAYNCGYPLALLDTVALTFRPQAASSARAYVAALGDALAHPASPASAAAPAMPPQPPSALPMYAAVEAGFAMIMIALTVWAMRRRGVSG